MSTIGQGVSAFLHLNLTTDDTLQSDAKATMSRRLQFTSSLLEPRSTVLVMEQGSWCGLAQMQIWVLSSQNAGLLQVEVDALSVSEFSTTTTYTLGMTISTSEPTCGYGSTDNHEIAESVDCQMEGANRVEQQLNVQTDGRQSYKEIRWQSRLFSWLDGTVAGVLLGEVARLVLSGRFGSGGQYRPSVLGRVHQLDRDLGLSAGDVPCSEHFALQRGCARCTKRQATLHHEPDEPGLCRVDSVAVEEMSNKDECSSASSEVPRR